MLTPVLPTPEHQVTSVTDGRGVNINSAIAPGDVISKVLPKRCAHALDTPSHPRAAAHTRTHTHTHTRTRTHARAHARTRQVDGVPPSAASAILFGAKESVVTLSVVATSGRVFDCAVMRNVPVRIWERWHRKEVFPAHPAHPHAHPRSAPMPCESRV